MEVDSREWHENIRRHRDAETKERQARPMQGRPPLNLALINRQIAELYSLLERQNVASEAKPIKEASWGKRG